MSSSRRKLAIAFAIMIGVTFALAVQAWRIWGGPLRSGGAFWALRSARPTVAHDHLFDGPAKHKGFVSTSSGIYVREDEDVVLSRGLPFRLTRTYLSGYHVPRAFGIGTTSNADWFLIGDLKDLSAVNLILADGGRIRFDRVSGDSYDDSLWIHRATPTRFNGSKLAWTGFDWSLRFPSGAFARFLACPPGSPVECLLTELRDEDGHVLTFVRDAAGTLLRIDGEETHITFKRDDHRRVVRITSPEGQIDYAYDARGRLVRVRESDGAEREYTYNDRDELLTINEPGWLIQNTWDDSGRVIRQTTVIPAPLADNRATGTYTIGFAYTVVDGVVIQTDVTEYDGTRTRLSFNAMGYTISEVADADGLNPVTTTFTRDPVTMYTKTVSISCMRSGRRITASSQVRGSEEETKWILARAHCDSTAWASRSHLFAAS